MYFKDIGDKMFLNALFFLNLNYLDTQHRGINVFRC
jgi:hypothetical protein